jgi:hypothetical protein
MKTLLVIHPPRFLAAGAAPNVRGQAAILAHENPDRLMLWVRPTGASIVLLNELDQSAPGFTLDAIAASSGPSNHALGDTPFTHQGRLYAASVTNVAATVEVMELVREGGGLGASPP